MAMGTNEGDQDDLFITHLDVRTAGHPFYEALDGVLRKRGFDRFVEGLCEKFYAERGRPSVAPGVYFRCLLVGYFEGIDSERGIAWRVADSMSLRRFLRLTLGKKAPDHSTLSRTRRLIDVETHRQVFVWVLQVLAEENLLKGQRLGVDATTLEANAALRSIVRRDDGRSYQEFMTDLAEASGIETPTRQDLARVDRKRRKKVSNKEWVNPHDPDAQIMKMKDGRTHLAHKQEHAVDLETGAVVAVTVTGGAEGDTQTIEDTLVDAEENLRDAREGSDAETSERVAEYVGEVVADKGYHSNAVLVALADAEIRSYISEPDRGRRRWEEQHDARDAVYRNRRRIRAERGKELLRQRGELLERPFAHALDTGGMRRTHLRGHVNILKRVLVHVAGLNLGLLMRRLFGVGKPRCLQGRASILGSLATALFALGPALLLLWNRLRSYARPSAPPSRLLPPLFLAANPAPSTTGC
jgi:transposase